MSTLPHSENKGKRRETSLAISRGAPLAARFCPWPPGRRKRPMAARAKPIMLHCEPRTCSPCICDSQIAFGWAKETNLYCAQKSSTASVCNKACVASGSKKERPAKHFIRKKSRPRRNRICVGYTKGRKQLAGRQQSVTPSVDDNARGFSRSMGELTHGSWDWQRGSSVSKSQKLPQQPRMNLPIEAPVRQPL